ncbi:hypothetical protein TGPRC2_311830 [Toxoplasma gondii TgCatPRC2]|uniref:Uncharacterized protein n=13 Tax=Toxoplasma gondii TaxID=5811 RepID=B9PK38_TOXGV|nr:hypothetical protein TGME49_311830 [Toxoplasma gondii ME49]EPR61075.1 hypothetical protein TGGT1_311830 [Toxoplasma gondii GT1]ESS34984.1 hypothetical protein TGVEG_311830 [Toxoplasma gondii VEG]KAF4639350.1 hypothetical protein TGRH88_051220 [Toxoplasma gondii]KFG44283.1 hypothetical protein TGDOM2_311830 [Toxoplasma gondii GAB2-2007-GAL-DOM2]KFG55953.1 hypothetical protein TGFOU_311830 [Toxoplasma gondii FOU]KFH09538.1 hypothetical protein TGVAND_311830 [Toxoplasma gondii VAND]KFH17951.|eukprot:XP_002364415.1 hypothetical protein TGME49_311830 [Toxoplasma gondii ME49]
MGKVKKQRKNRRSRAAPYEVDESMMGEAEAPNQAIDDSELANQPNNGVAGANENAEEPATGGRQIHKRQAAEWRKMKSEVAQLKKQRQKLRKKVVAEREERKKLGKLIKEKISSMRKRHDAELQALGLGKSLHSVDPEETMAVDD